MYRYIVISLVGAFVFNLAATLFSKDVAALRGRITIGKYLSNLSGIFEDWIGKPATGILKTVLFVLAALFLVYHLVTAILCLAAISVGTWLAKKAYGIPSINNVLNRWTTWINRIR